MVNIANLAQVHFLLVWEKFKGKKQVRFKLNVVTEMMESATTFDFTTLVDMQGNLCYLHRTFRSHA